MRFIYSFIFVLTCYFSFAQESKVEIFKKDSLLVIPKNTEKGFHNEYIFVLVEPNNTGKTSDSIQLHKKYAIDLATVSSVGNNISTMLKTPLLVPVFPRPSSQPLTYTHALDKDVIMENSPELKRLDLQLIEMIKDAKTLLKGMNIEVDSKIFMNGFSASGTFTNRFSFIHPEMIKALAIGGFNGELMLPEKKINNVKLNYPIGINDFTKIFDKKFDSNTFKSIPKFIYMGKLDKNDAVQFEDAYNNEERDIINSNLGKLVQERYLKCQENYNKNNINSIFKTYENVGHWTTSEVNLEVIKFFFKEMQTE